MMPDYEQQSLFRPPAGGPRRSCNGCGEGGGRINFKIGDIPVHIGQEVLDAVQLTLRDLPPEKRFEVLQAFSNVLENIKVGSIHNW